MPTTYFCLSPFVPQGLQFTILPAKALLFYTCSGPPFWPVKKPPTYILTFFPSPPFCSKLEPKIFCPASQFRISLLPHHSYKSIASPPLFFSGQPFFCLRPGSCPPFFGDRPIPCHQHGVVPISCSPALSAY